VRNHRIEGISGGDVGVRPPSLSASPMWPHGSISQFWYNPHYVGGDRFEGRMQDGTVTTESSHGRVGLVGSLPTGLHIKLGTGVHAL
jgi:hypothetical protein